MPDPAKLEALEELGYILTVTCSVCRHVQMAPGAPWGRCTLHTYQHTKHTGERPLGVHAAGTCPDAELNAKKRTTIEGAGYDRFLPGLRVPWKHEPGEEPSRANGGER